MENEIEEKKIAGILKTEVYDDENLKITILKQTRYLFKDCYKVFKGVILSENVKPPYQCVYISSCDAVEFREAYNGELVLYLKGESDRSVRNKTFLLPKRHWENIKPCLEASGFLVDKKEEKINEEENKESLVDLSNKLEEPTEEEINKMLNLVDIKTFTSILKNRLFSETSTSYKSLIVETLNEDFIKNYLITWAKNKYRFFKMFGDKLSINKDIKIEASSDMAYQELATIGELFPMYRPILSKVHSDAVIENKITKGSLSSIFFEDKKVKEGMKFTKFISLYGNKELDMELSKLYQNLGKCNITISIDPIDYLTVSLNKSGWKSCHNFFDGCYRNATLSYMFDETSLVSYSAGDKVRYSFEIPFEWNSKKWRQMIYVSKDSSATAFSRQYPNSNEQITKEVRNFFEEVFCEYFKVENKWKVYNHVSNGSVIVENHSLVYNDIKNDYPHKLIKNVNDFKYNLADRIDIGNGVKYLNSDKCVTGGDNRIWFL